MVRFAETAAGAAELVVTTAPDGLTVGCLERPGPVVALRLSAALGSRDDTVPGAAHAYEHLLFRAGDGAEARRAVERSGGEIGAATTREHLSIDVVVMPGELAVALDAQRALVRVVPRSTDVERERPVLRRELQHEAEERRRIWQLLCEALFGATHPLAAPIPGDAGGIDALDVTALAAARRRVTAEGCALAAVGPLDPGAVATAAPGLVPAGARPPRAAAAAGGLPGRRHEERRSGSLHLAVGWRFAGLADPDLPALRLAEVILAHGSGSRLYDRLRTQRGLAYRVSTVLVPYAADGYLAAVTACDPHHAEQAELALVGELERLAARGPSWPELEAAKRQHAGMRARAFESSRRLAAFVTTGLLAGAPADPVTEQAALRSVTPEDVRQACAALVRRGCAVASIGRRPDDETTR